MNYKPLIIILAIALILTTFFTPLAFAQGTPTDESNIKKRANMAYDRIGGPETIEKACEKTFGGNPDLIAQCIKTHKRYFCGIMTYGEDRPIPKDDIELDYLICLESARRALAGDIATALGLIAQIATKVIAPTGPGAAGAVIKGVKRAEDIIKDSKILKKEEKFDKQSVLDSLNKNLLNQKIPSVAGISIQNEKININIFREDTRQYSAIIGMIIRNGKVEQISEGALTDATTNVYLSESKVDSISRVRTQQELISIILSSLRDGSIRVSGVGPVRGLQTFVAQMAAITYSKFVSYPFDIAAGQTKTVNFGGREATLAKNPLGQHIVSVADSNVVYRVSRSSDMLGYSTRNIQKLIAQDPTHFKKQWGQRLSNTAGYYSAPTVSYMVPTWAGSGWYRPI